MSDSIGQVYVTYRAAEQYRQYLRARDLPEHEDARRALTAMLVDARPSSTQPADGLEGWRARSRALKVDVTAHVSREGPLAVVTHVHVRAYRPRTPR